jgi:hypothetical protein
MKPIDWPALIHQLNESGVTQQAISKSTGIPPVTLSSIKAETIAPIEQWNRGLMLLDLYLQAIGTPPPRIDEGYQF